MPDRSTKAGPEFRWDVPGMEIIVRGDIAVTGAEPDGGVGRRLSEMWSRGTRIFQRIDGASKMIHQHVSFQSIRPRTTRMDLEPAGPK
jgi:hypothetical protein